MNAFRLVLTVLFHSLGALGRSRGCVTARSTTKAPTIRVELVALTYRMTC
ncbi:MAG TPA: hypothetical protein VKM54_16125 [Myxococcota bacterium]|nr:hypothetical protein [Myxococcota bacterium]